MPRSNRLSVEQLEDRRLPSVFGMPWADADRLSVSFAADGTGLDGSSSALFQTFNATMSTNDWKREILRAFQTWAVQTNINIGLVADGGQAFGVLGALQADSRFGDFRIGAKVLPEHLAINMPFSPLSGTRAGDITFNTAQLFGIGDPTRYDLYTVALNEVANAMGLMDSDDPSSALYGNFDGRKYGLTATDIAAIRSLYGGERLADANEGIAGNNTFATATALAPGMMSGDITTLSDADVFQFIVPDGATVVTLRVQTGGISLLAPKLTIYDSTQTAVATGSTTDPLTGQVVLELNTLVPGQTYYAKVESGVQSVFGIGAYRLRLHIGAASTLPNETPNNVVSYGDLLNDAHTDDTLATAVVFSQTYAQVGQSVDYRWQGKISDAGDADYYRLTSPTPPTGKTSNLVAMVWAQNANDLNPKLSVYDADGNLVAAEVLVNDAGTYTVQVKNAAVNATYYLKVEAASTTAHNTGDYFVVTDFRTDSTALDTAASATLNATTLEAFKTLDNYEAQMFHLAIPATTTTVRTAIRLTVYNSTNQVVFSMISKDGEAATANIVLAAGKYTFRIEAGAINNQALPSITFTLKSLRVSDPMDPPPLDPAGDPPGASEPTSIWTTTSTAVSLGLQAVDPYSNPWDEIF
jgi:matrixin